MNSRRCSSLGATLGAGYHSGRCSQGGTQHACSEVGNFSAISAYTLGEHLLVFDCSFPFLSSSVRLASTVRFSSVTNAVCKLPPRWVYNSQPLWNRHYMLHVAQGTIHLLPRLTIKKTYEAKAIIAPSLQMRKPRHTKAK